MNIPRWASVFRKAAFIIMLCALFISTAYEASAQTGGTIKLEAQAGLDGACKPGAWLPVRVTVENSGGDFDARVQASYTNDQGRQSVYAVDISLPATSRKEFFLYIHPTGSISKFRVSVLEGNTLHVKKDLNVSCTGNEDLFFGVLADDPTPYNILNDIHSLNGAKTRLAQLTISDLPDRAQGWLALDALVISNVDTGKLTADQKQAMQSWLANGGKLFITGGIHWQTTTAGLRDFLPVDITATKNVMGLSALSAYVKDAALLDHESILAGGKILSGAHVIVAQNNIPLLVEKKVGYGKVYYFAADPGLQPLTTWDGMKNVYDHLLAFKPQKPSWAYAAWEPYQANSALSALPELNLPSFLYICCWLGVYILAIGPVNYLILRRAKRTELAWVTVPVLVILFSCLAYISGFAYRGINPILNRMALGQGWDGMPQARVNDLVGVYSPSRTTYNVQTRDEFMLYQLSGMDTDLQGSSDWLLLKQESGTTLPDVRVEIGGMRSVGAEGFMPALNIQHDLTLTMTKSAPLLTGTITNTSGHILRDAVLVTGDEWTLLGDLAPNETSKVNHSIVNRLSSIDMYTLLANVGMSNYPASTDKDLARHSAFFQANVLPYNGYVTMTSGIYLMGWLDDVAAPVNLQDQNSDAIDTMLYFQKLTPEIVTDAESFIINSSMYDWESSIGTTTTSQISSDGYEIHFQPAEPVDFSEVSSLALDVQSNAASDKIHVSLWNFETGTWDTVSLLFAAASTAVPHPSQYVGADGEIRIRLNADQNDYVQINAVNFVLGVKP